jgi:hypothetical protein
MGLLMSRYDAKGQPFGDYYRQMFPPGGEPVSEFVAFKRVTAGRNIVMRHWAARTIAADAYATAYGKPNKWHVTHPPLVLVHPTDAHSAACLGCTWLSDTFWQHPPAQDAALAHCLEHQPDLQTRPDVWTVDIEVMYYGKAGALLHSGPPTPLGPEEPRRRAPDQNRRSTRYRSVFFWRARAD